MNHEPPFKKATLAGVFEAQLEDPAAANLDPEVKVYAMLQKIASLYCTGPGECWPTTPKTYLSSDEKWGPYYICLMPYTADDTRQTTDDDTITQFDRVIHKRLGDMADHLAQVAGDHLEIQRPDDMVVLTFRSIDAMIDSCQALLNTSLCAGSHYEKAKLSNNIPLLRSLVAAEREGASQSVTYRHIDEPFAAAPAEPEKTDEEPEKGNPYHLYLTYVTDALGKIVAHCGDRDGFEIDDLLISAALQDDGFLLIIRKYDDEGERRLSGGLQSFMRELFEMLDEQKELAHVNFLNLSDAFAIKMPEAEDAITLLRVILENIEEERVCCVDDLEGVAVYGANPDQTDEALRFASDPELGSLEFLPGGLQTSFNTAALIELESFDQGVIPFSLKQLEYLLWEADARGQQSYVPPEYQAFVRH